MVLGMGLRFTKIRGYKLGWPPSGGIHFATAFVIMLYPQIWTQSEHRCTDVGLVSNDRSRQSKQLIFRQHLPNLTRLTCTGS